MRLSLAFALLASLTAAQGACAPGWAPGEFPLAGVDGSVQAMTTYDDGTGPALYVGGGFTAAGTTLTSNIAKWDGAAWSTVGAGLNGIVCALTVYDDGSGPMLYAGGGFMASGTTSVPSIARWNGSSWSPVGSTSTGALTTVRALAVHDDGSGPRLVAGGAFGVARWNGTAWTALGGSFNGTVYSMASCAMAVGPRLFASGSFTSAGAVLADKIACWNGTAWSNLGAGSTAGGIYGIQTLASWNDGGGEHLYVGGDFTTVAGFPAMSLARWNGTAWVALPYPAPVAGQVFNLAVIPDGTGTALCAILGCQIAKLTAGGWWLLGECGPSQVLGAFNSAAGPILCSGSSPGRVSRWTGAGWEPLGNVSGAVQVVANLDDGTGPALYAAGSFVGIGSSGWRSVAKRTGSSWTTFGNMTSSTGTPFGPIASIEALAVFDDGSGPHIYAGGSFQTAGGVPALNVARRNGSSWGPLGPGLSGAAGFVLAMAVGDLGNGSRLFVAGSFLTCGAQTVNNVAAWDGSGWSPLGTGMTTSGFNSVSVQSLVFHDDGSGPALYAGGYFNLAGGTPANGVARWNGTTWSAVGTNSPSTYALAVFDDGNGPALYAGAQTVMRWNGTSWTSIGTALPAAVFALAGFDDGTGPTLYAAGYMYGGSLGISRWNGVSWSTPGAGLAGSLPGFAYSVQSLAVADDGGGPALFAGGDFTRAGGQVSAGIAKWKAGGAPVVTVQPLTQAVDPGAAVTLSVTAVGAPPLSYQWRKDGVAVPGAIATTLVVPTMTPGEVATYDIVITNPCGTTTSQPAYVAVHPVVLTLAQPQGAGSILVANTSGIPGSSYFSAFTFESANFVNPGNGFWLGLHIPYPELLSQFLTQTPPFVGVLNAIGGSAFALPAGAIAPSFSGTRVFALTAIYDPVALTVIGGSEVESLLLQ